MATLETAPAVHDLEVRRVEKDARARLAQLRALAKPSAAPSPSAACPAASPLLAGGAVREVGVPGRPTGVDVGAERREGALSVADKKFVRFGISLLPLCVAPLQGDAQPGALQSSRSARRRGRPEVDQQERHVGR